jgi:predicted nuclease of predicted toxin-antitoxin system
LRILLDENLDWRLVRDLPGHTVESVPRIGWAGLTNGQLFIQAEGRFDLLITMDAGLPYQHNLRGYKIAVVILQARSNRLADTRPLMPKVLDLLENLESGKAVTVSQ